MNTFQTCGSYTFDFTESGFFTLVDKQGESVYTYALPLFEKLMSHLVWVFFWLVLILVTHLFLPASWLLVTDRLFMALVFFHLFVFGCRLTTLLVKGGLKPILFPPLWMRITRKLQKGAGMDLLRQNQLDEHPGLLTNLALVYYSQKQPEAAHLTLKRALSFAPDHPVIIELYKICSS